MRVRDAATGDDLSFVLFACCVPVRGARRSTLCDLQRGRYHLIPNGLYEILTSQRGATVREVKRSYGGRSDDVIDEYYEFLHENELGFWTDAPAAFPDIDPAWDRPSAVTNAIIDVDGSYRHDFADLVGQLEAIGCAALQVRVFGGPVERVVREVLESVRTSRLRSLELVVPYVRALEGAWDELCLANQRLAQVVVHSAPAAERRRVDGLGTSIVATPQRIDDETHCGQVAPGYFVVNVEMFFESMAANSCLSGKVAVDKGGHIRKCPSMPTTYGHVSEVGLADAVGSAAFAAARFATKDEVEVCRDCEFRYVCTDCRAYTAGSPGDRSKPAKCRYDPYTAEWAGGETAAGA